MVLYKINYQVIGWGWSPNLRKPTTGGGGGGGAYAVEPAITTGGCEVSTFWG